MIILLVVVYAFVFVCCNVAFHISRACKLHFLRVLLVCGCMLVLRVVVYVFVLVCRKVAFYVAVV